MPAERHLITGGAGFIGANLADRLLEQGERVTVLDSLAREGARANLEWLRRRHGERVDVETADVRDAAAVRRAVAGAGVVYHLAGQTAVTVSIADPRGDFEANALGTLNVLEAVRHEAPDAVVVHASTNKVYGAMEDLEVVEDPTRYRLPSRPDGVREDQPLDFRSPYGCSKGAADQYVRDYHRVYGLRTVVLRQSCVYGSRQFGTEDQGWVAWLMLAAARGLPLTIYGTGKQVRDLLHVADLVEAYGAAVRGIDRAAGEVYNVGGGSANALSVWTELEPLLTAYFPVADVRFEAWREGDQRVFVADVAKARHDLGWAPRIGVHDGLERLAAWVRQVT